MATKSSTRYPIVKAIQTATIALVVIALMLLIGAIITIAAGGVQIG